jgi:hypothetical protein
VADDIVDWLRTGAANGWCSPVQCQMHSHIAMTPAEWERYEAGEEPCVYIVRVYVEGAPHAGA